MKFSRPALIIFILSLFLFSHADATVLKIVTGEYAPYCGEKLYKGGMTTQIVDAVFKELKKEIHFEFVPWKRALNMVHNNPLSASYPWSKGGKDRDEDLYFSNPIHEFRISYYVRKDSGIKKVDDFTNKKLCRPNGWNNSYYQKTIQQKNMTLETPTTMDSCLKLFEYKRVDILAMDEMIGKHLLKDKLKSGEYIQVAATDIPQRISFHFVMSKKSLFAKEYIENFNKGLKIIKDNGTYQKIISNISFENVSKSNCGTCNRSGSL